MLSERLPHEADTTMGLLRKIVTEPPVPIASRRDDLPAPLVDLVGRMLAKDPEERPTAARAREALAAIAS